MTLTNFKGIKSREILFDGSSARVYGENGAGKTTCADAWYWVWSDTSYALTKNPPITPLGMSECESKVEIEMSLDGKPLTVSKSQKFKSKETDGKTVSSVTNSYEINSVEKSATNFVADLKERGINMDDFLILSNVFAFSADTSKQGREKMRCKLFEMVDGISDMDIAITVDVPTVKSELGSGYKIEEIEQKAKSSLKSIKEKYGLNNEIINAKIDGMLSSKADADISALTVKKVDLEKDIEELKSQLSSIGDKKSEITNEIMRLEKEKEQILSKANEDIKANIGALDAKLVQLDHERTINCANYDLASNEVNNIKREISTKEESLSNWRELYKNVQDEILDEKDLKCPTCGTEYSADRISEIKENFEISKNERLNSYKARGEETKKTIENLQKSLEIAKQTHSRLHEDIANIDRQMESVKAEISMSPSEITRNEETDAIDAKIKILTEEMTKDDSDISKDINDKLFTAKSELQEVIGEIAVGERNAEIDKKVEELREDRKNAEINRAMAEKTLNELEIFRRKKNETLSESINSHFSIAQFRLFKTLKNGTIEDDCAILVDGKELNSQLNQSTQVLALADITAGLQKFEDQYIPVFLDNHALFTSETDKKIPLESQLIKLVATEGIKELQIEKGE